MYKLCKTEQSALRQRDMEEALLQAMQNQRYEDISVSDLCAEIGVPRKTFYRYFDSKEDALYALMDHRMMRFEDDYFVEEGLENDRYRLKHFFTFWMSQKDLLDALLRSGISSLLVARAMQHASEDGLLRAGMKHYTEDFRDEAIRFMVCGLMNMMLRWHMEGFSVDPLRMAEKAKTILSVPLITNP